MTEFGGDEGSDPYLRLLLDLMPVRSRPHPPPRSWDETERALGIRFGPAYRAFLDAYGIGAVCDELSVFDPRHSEQFATELGHQTQLLNISLEYASASDPGPPLPPFPSADSSLLPLAGNGSAETFYAVVRDGVVSDRELWYAYRGDEWEPVDGPLSAVLYSVFTGAPSFEAEGIAWKIRPIYRQWNPDRPPPVLPPPEYAGLQLGPSRELLSHILPPPEHPVTGPKSWEDVHDSLGVFFPEGFRALVDMYGDGDCSPIPWSYPRSEAFESFLLWNVSDFEKAPVGVSAPLPPFLPGSEDGLIPAARSRLSPERIYFRVRDGVADESELWIGHPGSTEWVVVPGPLSALLAYTLLDVDTWGVATHHQE